MTGNPRVSVGIPVYNGARFLSRAIESLLAQDYEDFELIISDNASTDRTQEICEEYRARDTRIRYLRNPTNIGAAKNFNRVFGEARGEYFKWAAHDDWCAPTFLRRCVEVLDADPGAVLCSSAMAATDEHGEILRASSERLEGATARRARRRFHGMLWSLRDPSILVFGVIRSDALRRTGLIRNAPEPDRILLAELSLLGAMHQIPEVLFFRYSPPGHPNRDDWTWLDPRNARIKRRTATARMASQHLEIIRDADDLHLADKALLAGDLLLSFALLRTGAKLGYEARRLASRVRPQSMDGGDGPRAPETTSRATG